MRVSMADVAAHAGVSAQTVSRVVNGSPRVDPVTRARVEQSMAALGYRMHRAARALRTGRTRTVGVVAASLSSVGNARMLEAIAGVVAARDYALSVATLGGQRTVVEALVRLRDEGADGVIVLNEATSLLRESEPPAGMPLVVVDSPADERFAIVQTDHAGAAAAAVRHLLSRGARTVHHLAGPVTSFAARERERGWHEALAEAGIPAPSVVRGDWTSASGYAAAARVAHAEAVFAANDQMALGLLRALAEAGRSVPADVAVVGFDDVADAAQYRPPLSTMRQDFPALGARAVAELLAMIEEGAPPTRHEIPAELVVRDSSAAP